MKRPAPHLPAPIASLDLLPGDLLEHATGRYKFVGDLAGEPTFVRELYPGTFAEHYCRLDGEARVVSSPNRERRAVDDGVVDPVLGTAQAATLPMFDGRGRS